MGLFCMRLFCASIRITLHHQLRIFAMLKTLITLTLMAPLSATALAECPAEFNKSLRKLHSKDSVNLCDLYNSSKALLIVNTASHCGFTQQFKGLEALHKKYVSQGLVVVGFPSDAFKQEEKNEEGTARVCYQNYGVTFVMTEHTAVKGKDADPIFSYLANKTEQPSWNFNKYLIDKNNKVIHFGSTTKPLDSKLEKTVAEALNVQAI
jgi:glutathione peroxidase